MTDETTAQESPVREGQRVAKVMARAGVCSRREAEAWIAAGRVAVNGQTLASPAFNVSETDDVRVDGQPLAERERTRLFLFHKPRGLVTTARDPEGRSTVFDALPPDLPRIVAVGRLDINTEGLLLLTNDGGLARVLELPSTGWLRRYRVRAHGAIDQTTLDGLREGVAIDGVHYLAIEARLDREQGSNVWITMGLREGKNREIKKVLEHLGLAVTRLIRVSFGPFELGDLAEGEVAEVRTRVLRDQLGAKLAREAGAEFDAPILARKSPEPRADAEEPRPKRGRSEDDPSRRSPREGRDGARGGGFEQRVAPGRGAPKPSAPERRRKHVSALRAEIAADAAGPRRRVERGATHDRKGRTVAVDRITAAGDRAQVRAEPRGGKDGRPAKARPFTAPAHARRPGSFDAKTARDGEGRERPFKRPGDSRVKRQGDSRARDSQDRPQETRGAAASQRERSAGRSSWEKRKGGRGPSSDRPARFRDLATSARERSFDKPRGEGRKGSGGPASDRTPRFRDSATSPRERPSGKLRGEHRKGSGGNGPPRARPSGRPPRPPGEGPRKGPGGPRRPPRKS